MSEKDPPVPPREPLTEAQIVTTRSEEASPTRSTSAPIRDLKALIATAPQQTPYTMISVPLKVLMQLLAAVEELHRIPRPRPPLSNPAGFGLAAAETAEGVADSGAGADFNDLSYDSVDADTAGNAFDGMDAGGDSKTGDNDY